LVKVSLPSNSKLLLLALLRRQLRELLHVAVARVKGSVDEAAALGDQHQRLVHHEEGLTLGRAVEVARLVVLLVGPAVPVALGVAAQRLRREVVLASASTIVSAASIPDFIAMWMPASF
jgi:hypothetical protein